MVCRPARPAGAAGRRWLGLWHSAAIPQPLCLVFWGGVIDTRKFIYDLWGDTVNTASRMESHGLAGGIRVAEAVYERLRDAYVFGEPRHVEIKGKGTMTTYLLMGKRT